MLQTTSLVPPSGQPTSSSATGTMSSIEARVHAIIQVAVDRAISETKALADQGIVRTQYLYYKHSTPDAEGELTFVFHGDPIPIGFKLATGEGLRCNVPYDNYLSWVAHRSRRLPILAWNF